jgi:hypothetical protein
MRSQFDEITVIFSILFELYLPLNRRIVKISRITRKVEGSG